MDIQCRMRIFERMAIDILNRNCQSEKQKHFKVNQKQKDQYPNLLKRCELQNEPETKRQTLSQTRLTKNRKTM